MMALACLPSFALLAANAGQAAAACGGEAIGTVRAGEVVDGRTFRIADGREVRLAAIEVPATAAGFAAKTALEDLIAGQPLLLRRFGAETDRYGRLVAIAYRQRAGREQSVQRALLAAGFARVGSRIGDKSCAAALLAAEQTARQARLGLWADPAHAAKQAAAPADILAERGRFALVEGKVESVRASGGTIYVNFGRRWSRDFTVTISRRRERAFAAAGVEPKKLNGRRIRVRGFVEVRGGPRIYAAGPEQIEIIGPKQAMRVGPR